MRFAIGFVAVMCVHSRHERYFDHLLVNRREAMDGASCTFFLSLEMEGRVSDAEIIARYVGAKHLRHI